MKKEWFRYMAWIPAMFMMIMIFDFSSNSGEQSSGQSMRIVITAVDIIENIKGHPFTIEERQLWEERVHTPIRKAAHMSEYMIFAITIAFPLYIFQRRGKKLAIQTGILCIAYACLDELHQLFVPGRSGKITDVFIDSIGICIGIFLVLLLLKRKDRMIQKDEKK